MTDYIQVQTTTGSKQQAEQIAQSLVEDRLAACVQVIGPIQSVYRWQNQIEQADEWMCSAKTKRTSYAAVEAAIRALHTYDCPEIVALPIVAGEAVYLDWLGAQVVD